MRKMPMIIWKYPATVTTRITYLSLGRCSVCSTYYIARVSQLDLLSQLKIQSHCTQALRWSTSSHLILLLNILQSIIIIIIINKKKIRGFADLMMLMMMMMMMMICILAGEPEFEFRECRIKNMSLETKRTKFGIKSLLGGLAAANFWK